MIMMMKIKWLVVAIFLLFNANLMIFGQETAPTDRKLQLLNQAVETLINRVNELETLLKLSNSRDRKELETPREQAPTGKDPRLFTQTATDIKRRLARMLHEYWSFGSKNVFFIFVDVFLSF
jgi:hypothetical protein